MEPQTVINIVIGLIASIGGWWCKTMWEALRDLQKQDKELAEKVGRIEVLVAGAYVKRDEFGDTIKALFSKLDKIEDKLDSKADKR